MRWSRTLIVGLCSSLTFIAHAAGQSHGIAFAATCASPKVPGQLIDCYFGMYHDDNFGDTLGILDAYAIVDPAGDAVSVCLEIVELEGNADFGAPPFLAILGPENSMLNGLPGIPDDGAVSFWQYTYVVQPDDPDPLPVQFFAQIVDLCDSPGTVGCTSLPLTAQFTAAIDLELCITDLDGDGTTGFSDVLAVIIAWGPCAAPCAEDVDGNGTVDFADILLVITSWGACGE